MPLLEEWAGLMLAVLWYNSCIKSDAVFGGGSAAETARAWIIDLQPGTWFAVPAVPGPKHVVNNLLHRMMGEDRPIIGRVSRGLYWRRHPPVSGMYDQVSLLVPSCHSAIAPPGSGYADYCALNIVGWSTQVPARTAVAVPYRDLVPPRMPSKGLEFAYSHRHNKRRRDLNWNEATLLEAARAFGASDRRSWDSAMRSILHDNGRMKPNTPINKDRLLWAAETEAIKPRWPAGEGDKSFEAVMGRLGADLPDAVEVI